MLKGTMAWAGQVQMVLLSFKSFTESSIVAENIEKMSYNTYHFRVMLLVQVDDRNEMRE